MLGKKFTKADLQLMYNKNKKSPIGTARGFFMMKKSLVQRNITCLSDIFTLFNMYKNLGFAACITNALLAIMFSWSRLE